MENKLEKTYNIKPIDFIPILGSFIYQTRNWKDENGNLRMPEPYEKYENIGSCLTILNALTGGAIIYTACRGLEALVK